MYKTHQKLFARVFAKDMLKNMKTAAFNNLVSKGVFRQPSEKAMLGHIIPWIYNTTTEFYMEDNSVDLILNDLTGLAVDQIIREHGDSLNNEKNKRAQKKKLDEEKALAEKLMKEKLKKEKEEQKKKDDLKALHDKVEQQIILKGEMRDGILKQAFDNLHGNFQGKPTVAVLGGLLNQIAIGLSAAAEISGKADFINEKTAYVFMATYLSDGLKSELLEIYLNPTLSEYITQKGAKIEDLSTLDAEGIQRFTEEFKKSSYSDPLNKLIEEKLLSNYVNSKYANFVMDSFTKLLLKKLSEKEMAGKQGLAKKKIKIVPHPNTFTRDPLNPQAIVRIRIPMEKIENEDENQENKKEENEENKKEEKVPEPAKMQEINYEDKVLAVRPLAEDLYTFVIHQAAGRELRNSICDFIKSHFETELEGVELENMQKKVESIAIEMEKKFIELFPNIPVFDYEKN